MASSPRRVRLDFVAPVHRTPLAGAALCALGVAAAAVVGVRFQRERAERSRLEAALAAVPRPHRRAPSPEAQRSAAEAATVRRELSVPWTRLLTELEAASQDSASRVALLGVQPDPGKGTVRITAEVRELGDALLYLERLQKSAVLRDPMLESHERRKDDPEHPVRIQLSAGWRL